MAARGSLSKSHLRTLNIGTQSSYNEAALLRDLWRTFASDFIVDVHKCFVALPFVCVTILGKNTYVGFFSYPLHDSLVMYSK